MKKIVIALFLIAISGCAADKQSNKPPPADIKAYPEGLYAGDSSVAFFRAGKDGPLISLRSLVIGDAAEQEEAEKQTAPAAPTAGSKCPLTKQADPQPAATGAKLLQP